MAGAGPAAPRPRVAAGHGVTEAELDAIDTKVAARIDGAIAQAIAQPEPPLEWAFEDLYADPATLTAFGGTIR